MPCLWLAKPKLLKVAEYIALNKSCDSGADKLHEGQDPASLSTELGLPEMSLLAGVIVCSEDYAGRPSSFPSRLGHASPSLRICLFVFFVGQKAATRPATKTAPKWHSTPGVSYKIRNYSYTGDAFAVFPSRRAQTHLRGDQDCGLMGTKPVITGHCL